MIHERAKLNHSDVLLSHCSEFLMELILDLAGAFVHYLFGALVGVLYPARSRKWARWQIFGLALGLIALIALGLAATVAWLTDGSPVFWLSVLIGLGCLTGFAIVGNVCRKFHERTTVSSGDGPASTQVTDG